MKAVELGAGEREPGGVRSPGRCVLGEEVQDGGGGRAAQRIPGGAPRGDGRARLVTITPAGQELVELSLPVVRAVEAAWTEHLGPTRTRQLREALTELRTITDPFANVTEVS